MISVRIGMMGGLDVSCSEGRSLEEAIESWGSGLPKCTQPISCGHGGEGITSGWWQLFKGGFGEHSTQGQNWEKVHGSYVRLGKESRKGGGGQVGS